MPTLVQIGFAISVSLILWAAGSGVSIGMQRRMLRAYGLADEPVARARVAAFLRAQYRGEAIGAGLGCLAAASIPVVHLTSDVGSTSDSLSWVLPWAALFVGMLVGCAVGCVVELSRQRAKVFGVDAKVDAALFTASIRLLFGATVALASMAIAIVVSVSTIASVWPFMVMAFGLLVDRRMRPGSVTRSSRRGLLTPTR